ncbi:NADPH:quinone reductase [Chlorella sorokiniana]|uniref:NADPH:quinone reductase n=1 Tax=Chlorella sorokiniana TaxID=3076 RepID=A0A2P6TV61_CHLSO|nr:NADPH:quinone reductase [Chlorella sorokiniana]|eukprot:PRW57936.1 NADPH:quinone reductase [Chlorella sorokiniana]
MKAVILEAYNPEERLRVADDWPRPVRRKGEVLVRVAATAVNRSVYKTATGFIPRFMAALPKVPGGDLAGEVVEGDEAGTFQPGDRAFACVDGWRPEVAWGTYAELCSVPAAHLARIPEGVSYTDAAALCLTALTAFQALKAARLQPGQRVLVHAAAGGVGSAAVQIAKAQGMQVVATASAANAEFARSLGADQVIDYKQQRFEEVLAGSPVDAVIDTIGGEYERRSLQVLKRSGTFVNLFAQFSLWPIVKGKLRALLRLGPRYETLFVSAGQDMQQVAELVAAGRLRPHVQAVMPLEQASEAHRMVYSGHTRGKVVLQVRAE